ncbi:MAG: DNA helicase RecQ [Clostridia bacterium]
MKKTEQILKDYFGYDKFRDGQLDIIDEILYGNDVLGIMPTGAGKSICFQVPAMAMEGITLVVSPLISLMQDQVKGLIQSGIKAAYINSSLTPRQIDMALHNAKMGMYKIIYVAPERLLTDNFLAFAQNTNISMITIDEAHCISQWGQDFRPSYAQIPEFINILPKRPVVSAFTATATEQVKTDIVEILQLNNPLVLVSGFDRENLYFEVKNSHDKIADLLEFLEDKRDKSGIVYCATRKAVEQVCEELDIQGFSVKRYHAGLSQDERKKNQQEFIFDDIKIIVATNAFGMGIDKSNVNFVVHYNMPKDVESYYQEAGRAGRDGSPAHCLMLYSGQDVITNQFLIESSRDVTYESYEIEKNLKELAYKRLKEITFYSTTNECLRKYILNYFGDKADNYCGNCSNCDTKFELMDATEEAKKIISCVIRVHERFGKVMIIDILKGSKNKKILELGFDKLSVYGISDLSSNRLRSVMDNLIFNEYLVQTDSQYSVIQTTEKSKDILKDKATFEIKVAMEKEKKSETQKKNKDKGIPADKEDLFESLRELRAKFAKEQSVPAFVIFGDFSLIDMCNKLPVNENQFLSVTGVGKLKQEKYGAEFTNLILHYCKSKDINCDLEVEVKKRKSSSKKGELVLPSEEMISEINITDEEIPVSMINNNINDMLEYYDCTKTSAVKISDWLVGEGYLKIEQTEAGNTKVPTETGFSNGITQQEKTGNNYSYKINLYPSTMQKFIVENLLNILKLKK